MFVADAGGTVPVWNALSSMDFGISVQVMRCVARSLLHIREMRLFLATVIE